MSQWLRLLALVRTVTHGKDLTEFHHKSENPARDIGTARVVANEFRESLFRPFGPFGPFVPVLMVTGKTFSRQNRYVDT